MSKLTCRNLYTPALYAMIHALRRQENRLAPASETNLSNYLAADPQILMGVPESGDWTFPVSFGAGSANAEGKRALAFMAGVIEAVTGNDARVMSVAKPRNQRRSVRERNGVVEFYVADSAISHVVSFSAPRNALEYVAMLHADKVMKELITTARYAIEEGKRNALASLLDRCAEALTLSTSPDNWFLSDDDHTALCNALHVLGEADDSQSMVSDFIGMHRYGLVEPLLNEKANFEFTATKRSQQARRHGTLIDSWVAMSACEPLAFLLTYVQMHAPLYRNDSYHDSDANEFELPARDEMMDGFEYCVFLNTEGTAPESEEVA